MIDSDLTTRSETVTDKVGSRPRTASVITVSTGKPEHLATLTTAWSTAGVELASTALQGDANLPVRNSGEPPREPGDSPLRSLHRPPS